MGKDGSLAGSFCSEAVLADRKPLIWRFHMMRRLIALLSLAAIHLPAQYMAQFLPPPVDQPGLPSTDAFALNNMGQVFGRAINSNGTSRAPALWTGGVGKTLVVPAGCVWGDGTGVHFVNDSGIIVAWA